MPAAVNIPRPSTPTFLEAISNCRDSIDKRLTRSTCEELQVNLGRLCNQACHHCHVDAGPKRKEIMSWAVMRKILMWLELNPIKSIDITGGAPELNPNFRRFVEQLRKLDKSVTVRCNLTVLFEPGQQSLAQWYCKHRIHVVSSLPCYSQKNVDSQRGDGVFEKSMLAIQQLNHVGYGENPDLILDLVYNPGGSNLSPPQSTLEIAYKDNLWKNYGVRFNRLLTINNLPINRFAHYLRRTGEFDGYMRLLRDQFNPATVHNLMCRQLINVDWIGQVYDCDFNQMLDYPVGGRRRYLWEIDSQKIENEPIAVGDHCFGCTAGAGSSCGGSLV